MASMDFRTGSAYHREPPPRTPNDTLKLSGSICALATPFTADASALDLDAFGRLIDHQLEGGTRALVVAGSTGEGAALESDEFVELVAFAVQRAGGRIPVLAGSGLQSTAKTVAQTRRAAAAGAAAALVVTPAYVRPTQEGLYRHFSEVAAHGGLPILLYNVPTRSACDLLPETVARLCSNAGIIGIKEAVADAGRMQALLALRGTDFAILSGDDPTCSRAIAAGADGVISVAANVVPAQMQALCERAAAADAVAAQALDRRLAPLFEVLGIEPNPIPLKWCLHRIGFGEAVPRLPLTSLSVARQAQAETVLAALGLLEAARATG